MTEKKEFKGHEFKGEVVFSKLDPLMARFIAAPIKGVRSVGPIDLDPGIFPEDFETATYNVKASILIQVEIPKKPKPKKK